MGVHLEPETAVRLAPAAWLPKYRVVSRLVNFPSPHPQIPKTWQQRIPRRCSAGTHCITRLCVCEALTATQRDSA